MDVEMPKITVPLKRLRRITKSLDAYADNFDVSFEFVVGSCFPNVYKTIMEYVRKSYDEGYKQGLKDANES